MDVLLIKNAFSEGAKILFYSASFQQGSKEIWQQNETLNTFIALHMAFLLAGLFARTQARPISILIPNPALLATYKNGMENRISICCHNICEQVLVWLAISPQNGSFVWLLTHNILLVCCQLLASLVDRSLHSQHGGPGFDSRLKQ